MLTELTRATAFASSIFCKIKIAPKATIYRGGYACVLGLEVIALELIALTISVWF